MQNKLFIGGEFVDAVSGATIEVINPHDCSVITEIAEARAEDVDRAVDAAVAAFPAWRAMAAAERGRLLLKLADAIEANGEELAQLESLDTGHPISDARKLDVPRTAACFRYFGGMADKLQGDVIPVEPGFLNYVQREPLGVVGQIVPWNFPLMFCSWKMGPALAAGNTVVLKPSELTPLSSLRLAELMVEVGFPAGVVNMVPGFGAGCRRAAGDASRRGQDRVHRIDRDRRRIVEYSASNLKRVQLELGGKGANIVFDDADHSRCRRWQRVRHLPQPGSGVHRRVAVAAAREDRRRVPRAIRRAGEVDQARQPVGSRDRDGPTDVADAPRSRAELREGCDRRGRRDPHRRQGPDDPALANGCYIEPTVVRAKPGDRVCQEEVFGPFVTVSTFADEDEALAIANSTEYGLGGGLWTQNLSRAHRLAGAMRSGMVWVNSYKRVSPASPFGGTGLSGYGREMGFEAMREYTEAKSIWINVDAKIPPWYPR